MLKDPEFKPLTVEESEDLKRLFNENHRFNGCWCMYRRIERKDFDRNYGGKNQRRLRRIVEACPLIRRERQKALDVVLHGALFNHIKP